MDNGMDQATFVGKGPKIYKYPLQVLGMQTLTVPRDAKFLSLQVQKEQPCLWATVDPEEKRVEHWVIYTIGTGHSMPEGIPFMYMGTYQLGSGAFVGHVFVDAVRVKSE